MITRAVETRRGRFLLAGLVLLHLVIISRQVDGGDGSGSLLERVAFAALSPLQTAVAWGGRTVRDGWYRYVDLRRVQQENQALEKHLRESQLLLQERSQRALEAELLRDLLELRKALPLETLVAEVIACDGVPFYRTLSINKGKRDGVRLNAPVLSATGVVGRVIRLGPSVAEVQLLLDHESGLGVRIERSRVAGVIVGQGGFAEASAESRAREASGDLVMKYVPLLADVVPGDVVATSGLDRIYPKGLMVGRVRSVTRGAGLFKDVLVAPSAGFDRLEVVMVVRQTPEPEVFEEAVR